MKRESLLSIAAVIAFLIGNALVIVLSQSIADYELKQYVRIAGGALSLGIAFFIGKHI